jgi:hypothetical protein
MSHPLNGPRLKIERAKSQIGLVRAEDERLLAHADYRLIVAELDAGGRKNAIRALVNVLPPDDLGVCVGEIAHNLRSALDGLVYRLERLRFPNPPYASTRTQFPIFDRRSVKGCRGKGRCRKKPRHFRCNNGAQMIQGLWPCHRAAIKLLQPYHRGNLGKKNPLYLLQELNNADKHRLLQVLGGRAAGYFVGGGWGEDPALPDYHLWASVLEDGAHVGDVSARFVRAGEVRMDQQVSPYIVFWKGCDAVYGRGVAAVLSQIAEHVSEIVESFAPEFEVSD